MDRPPAPEPAPYGTSSIVLGASILAGIFGVVAWFALQPTVMLELDAPAGFNVELDGRPLLKCEHEKEPAKDCDRASTVGVRHYRWPIRPGQDTTLVVVAPDGSRAEATLSAPAEGVVKKVADARDGAVVLR